jgi:tRNA-dihydrouridine synthase B
VGAEWYAIWTRSRHEQVVREQLEGKRIEAFLPTVTRWSRWKDRKKKIDWPLFPGYCFARFDPAQTLPILKCTGVVSIVSFEGKPAPIPEIELESIRVLIGSQLRYDPCPLVREGMMVEVVHGPLRGVVGRLIRKDTGRARLILSVDLIGQAVSVEVDAAAVAPMAGMTDTAFRRLVKRHGGCGLVVTEMVSSEGLVRGIDRTLEYAEFTEEERPVSIQIFGGDPDKMAAAAQIVEGMGADIVDVNMGCPVPKIARHNAGCSLMREPAHAAAVVAAMARRVRIPVTVKMRAGWSDAERNAPTLARMVEDAGAAAVAVHGRTAAQSYTGSADWELVAQIADALSIPVFGSGDCVEPDQVLARMQTGVEGVLVGRGVLRNPWILAQAADLAAGRPPRPVTLQDRGRFLLEYIELLMNERVREPEGFRHVAPGAPAAAGRESAPARSHDRWVVNKIRALGSWYTKGLEGGSHLHTAINSAESLGELRAVIARFFQLDGSSTIEPILLATGADGPDA